MNVLSLFDGISCGRVACVNTNRNFIGIELDEKYFEIATKRIKDAQKDKERGCSGVIMSYWG